MDSTVGEGSCFWFEIDLEVMAAASLADADAGQAAGVAAGASELHVLLVEDNLINQKVARAMVESLGHTVDMASNGMQAVSMAAEGDYDMVLMDWMMPEMDGLEATRRIRAMGGRYQDLPIVAMTANVTDAEREFCLQAEMDDFLAKPVKRAALARILARWGRARRGSGHKGKSDDGRAGFWAAMRLRGRPRGRP